MFKLENDPGIIKLTQDALEAHKAKIEQTALLKKVSQWTEEDKIQKENLQKIIDKGKRSATIVERYHDWLITTENMLGQEIMDQHGNMNWDKPHVHQCTKSFSDFNTDEQRKTDYINLQCTCERHTYCKPGYCLRRRKIREKN